MILLTVSIEWRMILQNIWRRVVQVMFWLTFLIQISSEHCCYQYVVSIVWLLSAIVGINGLTFMLVAANLANTKWCKKPEKWLKPWHMGTHLRALSESIPTNTSMTVFRWFVDDFKNILHPCALDERSLSVGRVRYLYYMKLALSL